MLAVDLVEEASPWIIEGCRTLIESEASDKAAGPLRALLTAAPTNREARSMLGLARKRSVSGKKLRRNSLVGLSALLVLSLGALVKVRVQNSYELRLAEISSRLDHPEVALAMLQEHFEDDRSPGACTDAADQDVPGRCTA